MTALGAFSAGDVLTAADLNAIGTWTSFTPTVSAQTGTITTANVEYAKYVQVNEVVIAIYRIHIANAGTGSGFLAATLPVTPVTAAGAFTIYGRETQVTGYQLSGEISFSPTTRVIAQYYDGTGVVVAGRKYSFVCVYEAA